MRGSVRTGYSLFILLAVWSVTGGILAGQMGLGKLNPAHRLLVLSARHSRRTAHSTHPMADDDMTHFSVVHQSIEVLPFTFFLLIFPLFAIPGVEKDLLSLTQRRRE